MSLARIIDGKACAADIRARVADQVRTLASAPGLAVVLVGDDPASAVYVRNKARACREAGIVSVEHRLPAGTSQDELLALVLALNADAQIDGILVQLPLPAHIDADTVIAAVDPDKDVDGFHPLNVGRLASGLPALVPCTPLGCLVLIEQVRGDLTGLDAVVVGRSNIVGKPMAQLLLRASATVTVAHSKTRDLADVCRRADILVVAAGRPAMVRGHWIKPGATVIDVGINRPSAGSGLVGDVAFDEAVGVAGAITPVPGGVGPMTIACLLQNTLSAQRNRNAASIAKETRA